MSRDLQLVERLRSFDDKVAVRDVVGAHTYSRLVERSARGASRLLETVDDLAGERVVIMVEPSTDHVVAQLAVWRAGGVVVPLCLTHPPPELEYVLDVTRPSVAIVSARYADRLGPLAASRSIPLLTVDELDADPKPLPNVDPQRQAMILFTSGTTGLPKGVVITHLNLEAQIMSLTDAWEWSGDDRILLTLPLHHVHGIVNVLGCALWNGAECVIHAVFDPAAVVESVIGEDLTLFMAVPTIYHRLIGHLEACSEDRRQEFHQTAAGMRLMVSGSAALPVPILERWRDLSGHTLLERYGMTEIGMALSNPYRGERVPGSVGGPLPGVDVRLVDEDGHVVSSAIPGEIQVRGASVFPGYWEQPEATVEVFTTDGWFRTGDLAVSGPGGHRILGRSSVDIMKTGGEKVSALEIEEVLLAHDSVLEVAVVGVEDPEWGDRVVAVLVTEGDLDTDHLRSWLRRRLAPHKIPKEFHQIDELPRNAIGKVVKPEVVRWLEEL